MAATTGNAAAVKGEPKGEPKAGAGKGASDKLTITEATSPDANGDIGLGDGGMDEGLMDGGLMDGGQGGSGTGEVPYHRTERVLRDQILYSLRKVMDPDLMKDIVACGFVKNLRFDYDTGLVSFTLELTTPACPLKESFLEQCNSLLKELDWVKDVQIKLDARKTAHNSYPGDSLGLREVRFILAVSSCKGGVGKSSVAVNLAYLLKERGAAVGIVDADVYGPSLNTLIPLGKQEIHFKLEGLNPGDKDTDPLERQKALASGKGLLIPVNYDGIKMMSYSYFRADAEAYAAVRGPIASSLAYQMVTQTDWGYLDYLILDLPPGTGDIHLTLTQSMKISGAIVVTTPHRISLIDVEKGINFFQKVSVPTLALVENMSFIRCPTCRTPVSLGAPLAYIPDADDAVEATDCAQPQKAGNTEKVGNAAKAEKVDPKGADECCGNRGGCSGQSENQKEKEKEGKGGVNPEKKCCGGHGGEPGAASTPAAGVEDLAGRFGVGLTVKLPLDPLFGASVFQKRGGSGQIFPFVRAVKSDNEVLDGLKKLADGVAREVSSVTYGSQETYEISTTPDGYLELVVTHGPMANQQVYLVNLREVRYNCQCAECIDEFTRVVLINKRSIPLHIHPKQIEQVNNYSVRITWSDGHQSLMAFSALKKLAQESIAGRGSSSPACLGIDGGDNNDW